MKSYVATAKIISYVDVFFEAENDSKAMQHSRDIDYGDYPVLSSETQVIEVKKDGWAK